MLTTFRTRRRNQSILSLIRELHSKNVSFIPDIQLRFLSQCSEEVTQNEKKPEPFLYFAASKRTPFCLRATILDKNIRTISNFPPPPLNVGLLRYNYDIPDTCSRVMPSQSPTLNGGGGG